MTMKGINGEKSKQINRRLVLRMLCTKQPISRIEITQELGLAKMTVSNIVSELIEAGLVREADVITGGKAGAGRKQIGLALSEQAPLCIGVWLSRDFCISVLTTMDLKLVKQYRIDFLKEEIVDGIIDKIATSIEFLQTNLLQRIIGVGIATVGPLDAKNGIILNPPNFFGIENYPITQIISERVKLPVFLQNDMNAGALVEKYYGAGMESRDFAYVGLTNGIGAGIVIDDNLFEGRKGFAGEIGHMIVQKDGAPCQCGNRGCLEAYVNVQTAHLDFNRKFGIHLTSFKGVCELSNTDERVGALLEETQEMLAVALLSLCNILDPEIILLGHDGAYFTDKQIAWLERRVNGGILARGVNWIRFMRSSFGNYAPTYGAATIVLQKVFDGELLYEEFFPDGSK